jgi:hypothetical protein
MVTAPAPQGRATFHGGVGGGAVPPSLALLLATGLTACAAARSTAAGSPPLDTAAATASTARTPKARASAAPAPPQAPARAAFLCGPADPEWEEWFDEMFGAMARTLPLALDPKRLQDLIEPAQVEAETMLRRGLQACDPLAAIAIERADWRQLLPDLSATVGANNAAFALQAAVTLRRFGDKSDFSDIVLAALTADGDDDRARAAEGARFFSLAPMREPLLERMRRDPVWEVRFHAAESLLDLADVYPRDLSDHPAIEEELRGEHASPSKDGLSARSPSAGTLTRFANAAAALDRVVTDRLAAGPCPPPQSLERPSIRAVPVNEALMALTADSRIGPCARHLAFVVFVPSAGGYDSPALSRAASQVGHPLIFRARPFPLPVDHRPLEATLRVGTVRLNLRESNVAVVAASGARNVVVRYRTAQDLGFARSGRPDPAAPSMLRFDGELAAAVRAVLDRSPELAAFVSK